MTGQQRRPRAKAPDGAPDSVIEALKADAAEELDAMLANAVTRPPEPAPDPRTLLAIEVADAAAAWHEVHRYPARVRPELIVAADRKLAELAGRYRGLVLAAEAPDEQPVADA